MNRTISFIALFVLFTGFCTLMVNAGEVVDNRSAEKFYQTCIGNEMAECLAQTPFQLTRSENLRAYAKRKASKAIFLADHLEELIREMTDAGIPLRRHSVEAYLNRRFAEEAGHPTSRRNYRTASSPSPFTNSTTSD